MFPDPPPAETPAVFPSPTVSDALPIPSPSDAQNGGARAMPVATPDTGPWAREGFMRHILSLCGGPQLDDPAIGAIMNAFPRVGLDDAKLWLAYMKDCEAANIPPVSFIMDCFRTVSWYNLLRQSDFGPELVELYGTFHF
ncbi:hypothetical protein AURDEDRAFT_159329 [Auricularia subglabra TFB-10046 SS5]|nr:hypothetical protein AURDEDRAFT_159329 [Auricularia subglabra TFB-10046 SS5]